MIVVYVAARVLVSWLAPSLSFGWALAACALISWSFVMWLYYRFVPLVARVA
jgi:hypothetical protein